MKSMLTNQHPHKKGQGMVEFALALPILLLLMMGIIEFARILQAWMAVQNGARFGLRYLVTGEYDKTYCEEAAAALNLVIADKFGGDPAGDCHVPDSYGNNAHDLSNALVDWARLPSAKDVSYVGATGVSLDNAVSGDYLDFLSTHAPMELGDAELARYFHVTVCSSRDGNEDGFGDFQWNGETSATYQTLGVVTCYDSIKKYLMDDAGGPGDRVRVYVTFKHSTIVPFISEWWPIVPLTAWREGIVERFRTSRISGIGSEIIDVPTDTPTNTPVPPTPTDTPEPDTPTSTNTPTFTNTPTDTSTPTPTSTPNCSVYSLGDFSNASNQVSISIMNNSSSSVMVSSLLLNWDYAENLGEMIGGPSRDLYLDWIKFAGTTKWGSSGVNDFGSPTDTTVDSPSSWSSPTLGAGSTTVMQYRFANTWTGYGTDGKILGSDYGLTVYLSNGCVLEREPVERPLPEINCELYTISSPTLLTYGLVRFMMRNNDNYASSVSVIRMTWDYMDNFFENVVTPADTSVYADWIAYDTYSGGYKVWGSANGGGNDSESATDTLEDATWSTSLPRYFDPGKDYYLEIKFRKNNEFSDWLTTYSLEPGDFGALIDFDNGCQLELPVIPRPPVTPTPSCDLLYSEGASFVGDDFRIRVRNSNFAPAYLTNSTLVWPNFWSASWYFDYVRFSDYTYWNPDNLYSSPISTVVPRVAVNGFTTSWWLNDFGPPPPVPATGGLFSGDLLFEFDGLTCSIYDEIMVYPTSTPVPTNTPAPTNTFTPTGTATNTRTPTSTRTPTNTGVPTDTATHTGTATNTSTITDTPTITNTRPPTNTSTNTWTPTNTPVGPTATYTASPTYCKTPPDMGGCH